MIDEKKYEGHTPADQWTTYKMGADKPYHAVRFGGRGLDLELKFGADAKLIADAPLLLAEIKRLQAWKNEMTDIINEAKGEVNTDNSRPMKIWWNLQYKLKEMIE